MNRIFAPESFTIAAKSCGVEDGAKGATATPARNAPRKVATYSIELKRADRDHVARLQPVGLQRRRDAVDQIVQAA